MKKKIANAIEVVLLIVSIIILSSKNMTKITVSSTGIPSSYDVSAIECMDNFGLTFIPMCLFYLLCIVMCVISIVSKGKYKDGKAHSFMALILFISVNYNLISCTSGDEISSGNFPGAILELVLFLAVVIAFAKRSPLIAGVPNETQTVINNIQETSNADELKKYKDLLESGTITQEEFDAKKKQLLGL